HVHIPVNPDYSSLNLAAAVMVLCYELRRTALAATPVTSPAASSAESESGEWDQAPATADEVERFLVHLESVLIRLDFHKPQYKRPLMRRLRRLYQRVQLDQMEVNILRGMLTAIEQAVAKGKFPVELMEPGKESPGSDQ
ncbi:MAG TPA: hypothetical protein VMH83_02955, partial [Candidatus Acidoferrum sp.]|nr:hypothetical protein [Candidatus Acidoferrum sp.]